MPKQHTPRSRHPKPRRIPHGAPRETCEYCGAPFSNVAMHLSQKSSCRKKSIAAGILQEQNLRDNPPPEEIDPFEPFSDHEPDIPVEDQPVRERDWEGDMEMLDQLQQLRDQELHDPVVISLEEALDTVLFPDDDPASDAVDPHELPAGNPSPDPAPDPVDDPVHSIPHEHVSEPPPSVAYVLDYPQEKRAGKPIGKKDPKTKDYKKWDSDYTTWKKEWSKEHKQKAGVYAPFKSELDWRFSEWVRTQCPGTNVINSLLGLPGVSKFALISILMVNH